MFKRVLLLAGVLFLGGLFYARAHAANATVVGASEKEFQITLSTTTISAGTPVQFQVANDGKIQHEFVVEKAGAVDQHLTVDEEGQDVDSEIAAFNPGETKTLEWTFTEPGNYQVACHIPGHYEAGMVAQFTVVAPSPANVSTTNAATSTSSSSSSGGGAVLGRTNESNSTTSGGASPESLPASRGVWNTMDIIWLAFGGALFILIGIGA